MAYITVNGERLEKYADFSSQNIINGGENMKKFYQAIILDKKLGVVTGESYVTAENKNQAFAKVDTSRHTVDRIKVFLNKIGEYKPQE